MLLGQVNHVSDLRHVVGASKSSLFDSPWREDNQKLSSDIETLKKELREGKEEIEKTTDEYLKLKVHRTSVMNAKTFRSSDHLVFVKPVNDRLCDQFVGLQEFTAKK